MFPDIAELVDIITYLWLTVAGILFVVTAILVTLILNRIDTRRTKQ